MIITFIFQGQRKNVVRYFREYTKEKMQITSCNWERRRCFLCQWAFSFHLGVDLESKEVLSRLGTVLYFVIRKVLKF